MRIAPDVPDKDQNNDWEEYRCVHCKKLECRYLPPVKPSDSFAFEIKCTRHKCNSLLYHGNVMSLNLKEFRCPGKIGKTGSPERPCNKLLAKVLSGTIVEIKCSRCRTIVRSNDGE